MKINPDHIYMPDGVYEIVDTEHGKGLKKVLGFVAAIAIPFAAPMIASAMGVSGALTSMFGMGAKLATTAASALTGAGLGAAKAAAFGENVGQGALSGAIGGGLSGFSAATRAAQTAQAAQAGATQAGLATGNAAGTAGLSTSSVAAQPTTLAAGVPRIATAGVQPTTLAAGVPRIATAGAPSIATAGAPSIATAGTGLYGGAGAAPMGPYGTYGGVSNPSSLMGTIKNTVANATYKVAGPEAASAISTGMSKAGGFAKDNPDLVKKVGTQIVSSALTSGRFSGMSGAEKRAFLATQEELQRQGELNKVLFAEQRGRAQQALNDANRIDPFGRAQQAANVMRAQAGVIGAEAARKTGFTQRAGLTLAEQRRAQLAGAERAAGVFDRTYATNEMQRAGQRNAAYGLFPTRAPEGTAEAQLRLEEENRKRREALQEGFNKTGGYLFGNDPLNSQFETPKPKTTAA